jgi:hypothetical protein
MHISLFFYQSLLTGNFFKKCHENYTKHAHIQMKNTGLLMDFEILMKKTKVYDFVQHLQKAKTKLGF